MLRSALCSERRVHSVKYDNKLASPLDVTPN